MTTTIATTAHNPATDRQVALVDRLLGEMSELACTVERREIVAKATNARVEAVADKKLASRWIDAAIGYLRTWRAEGGRVPTSSVEENGRVEEPSAGDLLGMHQFDGEVFKVQESKQGRPYAKKLVQTACPGHLDTSDPSGFDAPKMPCNDPACTLRKWEFVYAPGAVRRLSASTRISLEEAKEFGHLYGTCIVCGRTLTNPDSVAAGIGPVCAARF